jgi:periplasmic copper chaperone A
MSLTTRRGRRTLVPLVCTVAVVLGTALPAAAHVGVSSPDAAPGGFGKLVFRVPTESDAASTTKLEVRLPARSPFASVSVKPVAGWTVTTTEQKLDKPVEDDGFTLTKAVATVTWTAHRGAGIKPGEFDEFELSVGPFAKDARSVTLPTVQTYSDGSVVRWDEPTVAGAEEPEHPAPTLDVRRSTEAGGETAATSTPSSASTASSTASSAKDSPDGVARWLGGIGALLGTAALVVAIAGRRRGHEVRDRRWRS